MRRNESDVGEWEDRMCLRGSCPKDKSIFPRGGGKGASKKDVVKGYSKLRGYYWATFSLSWMVFFSEGEPFLLFPIDYCHEMK